MADKIIGHIVGLDEIHKNKLSKILTNIKIIDLDHIQQAVYNKETIIKEKINWTQANRDIALKQKQKRVLKNDKGIARLDNQIKKLLIKRKNINKNIHDLWREKINDILISEINSCAKDYILFVGYHIFPKDFRIRVKLPINEMKINNRLIYNISSEKYAANQIKYYLKVYQNKIINGAFPIKLLQKEYLVDRHEKLNNLYDKLGYKLLSEKPIREHLLELIKEHQEILKENIRTETDIINTETESVLPETEYNDIKVDMIGADIKDGENTFDLTSESVINNESPIYYLALPYKSGDMIAINKRSPLKGFNTKKDAINHLKKHIKINGAIYIYKVRKSQFKTKGNKIIAKEPLYPVEEESLMYTI